MAKEKGPSVLNGMFIALVSMAIFSIALLSEQSGVTGFVTAGDKPAVSFFDLKGFKDINYLGELAPGNYYISGEGVVYYVDGSSRFPVAKVDYLEESQKNRLVYIDARGNIGYLVE